MVYIISQSGETKEFDSLTDLIMFDKLVRNKRILLRHIHNRPQHMTVRQSIDEYIDNYIPDFRQLSKVFFKL